MMRLLFATMLVTTSLSFQAVTADVGVSVSIGQPGFYGRIDLGDVPYYHEKHNKEHKGHKD
jgi:hypothetical protein